MEGIHHYGFLHPDEAVTCEMVKVVNADSKPPNTDVTNIHVKSHTHKESQATGNKYHNASPLQESHNDNANGSNSTVSLNEVIIKCSEVSKQSQIDAVNNTESQNEFDNDDDDDDSAERQLLRDEFLKDLQPPGHPSAAIGSTERENQVPLIELRTAVTSPRSQSSSGDRRHSNEEESMSEYGVTSGGGPNL
jgi:hypothetical protein